MRIRTQLKNLLFFYQKIKYYAPLSYRRSFLPWIKRTSSTSKQYNA